MNNQSADAAAGRPCNFSISAALKNPTDNALRNIHYEHTPQIITRSSQPP
jgi:hypothetical protein